MVSVQLLKVLKCIFSNLRTLKYRKCFTKVGNMIFMLPIETFDSKNGFIIAWSVNDLRAVHDSTIADWGNIYQKLGEVY